MVYEERSDHQMNCKRIYLQWWQDSQLRALTKMPSTFYSAKTKIKQQIWKLQRYSPDPLRQNVALFTSRRSGSTWLMEVISANPEFRYITQPFVAYTDNGHWGHDVFRIDYGRFLTPSDAELESIATFIDGILNGKIVLRAPWKIWNPNFWRKKTRIVLKILQSKALMPWFEDRFNLKVIYLLRHPIAQSASVIKSGWQPMHQVYLANETFMRVNFTADQRDVCQRIATNGNVLEQHVLTWCLENMVPLIALKSRPSWNLVTYEECILKPSHVVDRLAKALDIDCHSHMLTQMPKPSGTTRISNRTTPKHFDEDQLTKWQRQFTSDQIRSAFTILSSFQIDAYSAESPLPRNSFKID